MFLLWGYEFHFIKGFHTVYNVSKCVGIIWKTCLLLNSGEKVIPCKTFCMVYNVKSVITFLLSHTRFNQKYEFFPVVNYLYFWQYRNLLFKKLIRVPNYIQIWKIISYWKRVILLFLKLNSTITMKI